MEIGVSVQGSVFKDKKRKEFSETDTISIEHCTKHSAGR